MQKNVAGYNECQVDVKIIDAKTTKTDVCYYFKLFFDNIQWNLYMWHDVVMHVFKPIRFDLVTICLFCTIKSTTVWLKHETNR